MSTHNRLSDATSSGSPLRNEAASFLQAIYGNAEIEKRVGSKKVDVLVTLRDHGRSVKMFVECKDYGSRLNRNHIIQIATDYEGLISNSSGSRLLIITRNGISTDADGVINEKSWLRHQTIWELEDEVLGLNEYVCDQLRTFTNDGLDKYYVPSRARMMHYDSGDQRTHCSEPVDLFNEVQRWISQPSPPPLAILGGYGAGKTSFSKRLISDQATKALADPSERRPVLIKLGNITRNSGLDGLLGSLFTHEYEVRGYSYRRFLDLNAKGRLLVVLDGFDEMKHAMSWTDFRNEIEQLNKLNSGNSRVILLGRPSAFTSDDEHIEVLRGRRRSPLGLRKLPDWPEFREYDLEPFSPYERELFVKNYLRHGAAKEAERNGSSVDTDSLATRIAEVNLIADREPDVFGKPVHAKILVELALDPDVDLSTLSNDVTRWGLYSEFFSSLARRETSKAARAPISEADRLRFLRKVALWLWQNKDGATAFKAADLTPEFMTDLPDGDADSFDDKKREYLTGSFLERKAGETYYFAHRSFAEFLVAQSLSENPPGPSSHTRYDRLVKDGIMEFLEEQPSESGIINWADSLATANGVLSIEYIFFLAKHAGGHKFLEEKIGRESPWFNLVHVSNLNPAENEEFGRMVWTALKKGHPISNAVLLSAIGKLGLFSTVYTKSNNVPINVINEITPFIVAALIDNALFFIREPVPMARLTVQAGIAEQHLNLAKVAAKLQMTSRLDRNIIVSWSEIVAGTEALLGRNNLGITSKAAPADGTAPMDLIKIRLEQITRLLSPKTSSFFTELAKREGFLSAISIYQPSRGKGGS